MHLCHWVLVTIVRVLGTRLSPSVQIDEKVSAGEALSRMWSRMAGADPTRLATVP